MTIAATGNATNAPAAVSAEMFGGQGADFNMFLKLLTTQMQHQDPLDPMDTSQYTQQLVQYSQVEQSIQQTGLLKDLLSRMSASDMTQASGLIGREVEFDSGVAGLSERPASWSWSLPHKAASITADILDSSGRTVATVPIDPAATSGRFDWEGLISQGNRAPKGAYVLKLTAVDESGAAVSASVRSLGRVDEVVRSDGELWLDIGGASLPLGELVRIAAVPGVA